MKKLIFGLMFLVLPTSAYASSASSTVINNVNTTSTNSNSQVSSHTEITTETNGKVTHYTSDEPNKTIHVESNNGQSNIEVNGNKVEGDNSTVTPTQTSTPMPTQAEENSQMKSENFLQKLFDQLKKPFEIIFVKLHISNG